MNLRRVPFLVLGLLFTVALSHPAWATMDNLKSFKEAHPGKAATCKTCHQNAIGKKGDLNAYGQALQKSKAPGDAKKLTKEDFAAVPEEVESGEKNEIPPPPEGGEKGDSPPSPKSQLEERGQSPFSPAHNDSEGKTTVKPKAEYVGVETCAACHAKEHKEFMQSTHARISVPGETKWQGCEMCHGPGSLHAEAGGGRGVGGIINPRKDPSTCFQCHLDKKAEFRLPYHHPVLEGKMSCADCHKPHAPEVRPWSSTSMEDVNEACFKCHKDQRGPFVWEHEALREGCTTCHKVHGSIHDKMLLIRDNNLCLRCHTQQGFPRIGLRSAHNTSLPVGTCFSGGCHTAPHGSNFDDHLRY